MNETTALAEPDITSRDQVAPPPPKMSVRSLDFFYGGFQAL
jgi:hypothetical protein